MGATPTYGLPYPDGPDSPNGPAQFRALAEAVEAQLSAAADNLALLQRIGSHATWTRTGTFQVFGDYVSFSGANLSTVPAGAGFTGDDDGLVIPYHGVFYLNAQIRWEGSSDFTRMQVDLEQGRPGAMATVVSEQVKHEAGTGSEEITMAGRASVMDAGDKVRLSVTMISGSSALLSKVRVHAMFAGDGQDVAGLSTNPLVAAGESLDTLGARHP